MNVESNRDSNEIADALRGASLARKARLFVALAVLVLLALGVLFGDKIRAPFSESGGWKRLFTTRSIVEEVEFDGSESESLASAARDSEPKTEPERNDLVSSELEPVEALEFEESDSAEPAGVVDVPAPEPSSAREREPVGFSREALPPAPKPRAKSRNFARAANLIDSTEPSPKRFASAANVAKLDEAASPNLFTEAAREASEARRLGASSAIEGIPEASRAIASQNISTVGYAAPEGAPSGATLAGYSEPVAPSATPEAPVENRAVEPAPERAREATPEELERAERSRADLREKGILGARIELWNAENFRATGMIREKDGSAYFYESFGATPELAAASLAEKIDSRIGGKRAKKSRF